MSSNAPQLYPIGTVVDVHSIPIELRENAACIMWMGKRRPDGKIDKIPWNAASPFYAVDPTHPDNHFPFDVVLNALHQHRKRLEIVSARNGCPGVYGLGVALTDADSDVGIDVDNIIDEATDEIHPFVMEIVERVNSYTEWSPSGKGLRIFVEAGLLPRNRKKKLDQDVNFEMSENRCFLTVTGNCLSSAKYRRIEQRFHTVLDLYEEHFPASESLYLSFDELPDLCGPGTFIKDDDELIFKMRNAKNGHKFLSLWIGDTNEHDNDDSRADMALIAILIFWLGNDIERIDRLFRRSGLMRKKWDSRRDNTTYGIMSIRKALGLREMNDQSLDSEFEDIPVSKTIATVTNIDGTPANDADASEDTIRTQRFELVHLKDIIPNYEQRFVVDDLIFEDSLVTIYGASNTGKSFVALDMLFSIARGVPWAGMNTHQRTVVYLAAEGGSGIPLRVDAYCRTHNIKKTDVPFYLFSNSINLSAPGKDSEELTALLDQLSAEGPPPIFVVDTLSRIMPGVDENAPNGMTGTIDTVEKLRHRYNATVILIHHTGKEKKKGLRGHSSLLGALDSSFYVDENSGLGTMEVDKQKDLAQDFKIDFELDVIVLKTLDTFRFFEISQFFNKNSEFFYKIINLGIAQLYIVN